MKKRFLSILTALCLTLTLLPTAALAADEEVAEVNGERFETLPKPQLVAILKQQL